MAAHSCFRKRLGLNCEAEENPYLDQLFWYSLLWVAMGEKVTNLWFHIPPCRRSMIPPKISTLWLNPLSCSSHAICWEAWKCKTQVCVCISFAWEFPIWSIHWIVTLSTLTYSMDIGGRWCLMLITYHDKYLPRTNILFAWCIFDRSTFCSIDCSYGKCEWNLLKFMNNVFLYLHVLKLILGYYCVQI